MYLKLFIALSGILICLSPQIIYSGPLRESGGMTSSPSQYQANPQNSANPLKTHYVGALHDKWQFTSDHLPMGATLDEVHLLSWNILNTEWLSWIELDFQGLKQSLITQENILVNDSGLTRRDQHVIDQMIQMIEHPTHPRSILALQECGRPFLDELKARLPENMQIVYTSIKPVRDQNVVVYNTDHFTYLAEQSSIVMDVFPSSPRPLMDIRFQKNQTQETYRIINAHVPGDPRLPGRYEIADYAVRTTLQGETTVVLGDMNFDYAKMRDAFLWASAKYQKENSFTNYAGYFSHVGVEKEASCIDHIFISSDKQAQSNQPHEVLSSLQELVLLLN